jgi:uncharacterized protein (TIGR02588 family)
VVKKKSKPSVKPHPIEWVIGIGSSLLVAAVIAIIGYEAVTSSGSPPDLKVSRLPPSEGTSTGQVRFAITNTADTTAAAVLVHGEWHRADGTIETAEVTLDYVPARSTAAGALIFSKDPGPSDLFIRAIGYADP